MIWTIAVQAPASPSERLNPLGLSTVSIPAENPTTPEKVILGERLFNDQRFSSTGEVSCSSCHKPDRVFTDSPLRTSVGVDGRTGSLNSPTVVNAAFASSLFWDGRSPTLEDQALHPFLNPVEMGLDSYDLVLDVVRSDRLYRRMFRRAFGVVPKDVTIEHVAMAIAAFERTLVAGDSRFDLWFYDGQDEALTPAEKRGYELFVTRARCVGCHVIEQTAATFTDGRFHNIGVGFSRIQPLLPEVLHDVNAARDGNDMGAPEASQAELAELGRFLVSPDFDGIGAFKTPSLRNVALTPPYMHDGSMGSLNEVLVHYNNGGTTPVYDFLSGAIRPLGLTNVELDELESFLKALTSPRFAISEQVE